MKNATPCLVSAAAGCGAVLHASRYVIAIAWLATSLIASGASVRESFDIAVLQPPTPVTVEGKKQLVYELHLTNFSGDRLRLLTLKVVDSDHDAVLAAFAGPALVNRTRVLGLPVEAGKSDSSYIAPGQQAILYVEFECRPSHVPRILSHSVEYSVSNESTSFVVSGGRTIVDPIPAIDLGPPLAGGDWAAVHHPDWPRGHRRVMYAVDGRARIPGRFAIDFIKVNDKGQTANGDADTVLNSLGYGTPVLAVAHAKVVAVRHDVTESKQVSENPKHSIEDAAGNYIVLRIAERRFVFYEHLKPGSIRVRVGEDVRPGQVIANLGFTGDSTGPHLHFHVADGLTPLGAEGLPFTFSRFTLHGHYAEIRDLGSAKPEALKGESATRFNEMPSANAVVSF